MSKDPNQINPKQRYANRGRSLSRQILGNDMDLVNKYASKYNPQSHTKQRSLHRTQTYSAVPVCTHKIYQTISNISNIHILCKDIYIKRFMVAI